MSAGPTQPIVGLAVIAAGSLVTSYALVGLARSYAIRADVLDRPNDRSSHTVATPRGGGLGLVAAFLVASALAATARNALTPLVIGALVAIAAVAAVGWVDDRRPLPVAPRLVVHVAAGATLAWLASPDRAAPIGALVLAAWAAWWVFWTVSAINVVNFMDGIDGLIGSQIALYSAYVVAASPSASYAAAFGAALAGAALGFLPWNWSPARIFLGDVGSGALGCAAVVAGLLAMRSTGLGIAGAFLPLFPLFLDGAATIVRRARRGERLTIPHRSHLYQRLANSAWGHARVSILYLVAAGAGAGVALWGATAGPVAGAAASCVYATAVAVTGWWLDRSVPLPPRERPHARAA